MTYKPKSFLTKLLAAPVEVGVGFLDKEAEPYIPEDVKKLIEESPLSDDFKNFLLPFAEKGVHTPLGQFAVMAIAMVAGFALGMVTPAARIGSFKIDRIIKSYRFDPATITNLWLRGYPDEENKEKWWDDLKEQGWSEDRIEAAQELAKYLPSPTEVMTWAAREVFEPELREKYQLDKFMPPEFKAWAAKVGISGEVADNYWAAHWVLPSLTSIMELWRRQILTKEDVDSFWTELDMVPWIREDLFKLFRAVPTRVDVRRWWDMRTIDEPRLRQIYKAQGYWEEDLEDYVTWTKVYTDFPDLIARYKNGWITESNVLDKLIEDGMPEDRAKELLETKFKKPYAEERVATTTALTRSLIIKGAKEGKLNREETLELLRLKNYEAWEAEYIYDIEVTAAASPETPLEFKRAVMSYRKSQGLSYEDIPQDLVDAEKALFAVTERLKIALDKKESQEVIDKLEVEKAEAEAQFGELKTLYQTSQST